MEYNINQLIHDRNILKSRLQEIYEAGNTILARQKEILDKMEMLEKQILDDADDDKVIELRHQYQELKAENEYLGLQFGNVQREAYLTKDKLDKIEKYINQLHFSMN